VTFVAIHLTQMLLAITDDLSAAVSDSVGGDATRFLEGGAGSVAAALGGVTGGFLMFFGALLVVIAGLLLWIQLLIRSAAIYVCVFFLPLVLAGLVWPATARWTKRLVETLIALILSKFVIVAIISLAVAAMGRPLSESGGGGVGTVVGGASLLLLAAFSPFALFKLIPLAEASSIGHLEGMERRPANAMQGGGGGFSVQGFVRDKVASGRAAQGIGGAAGAGAGAGAATAATAGGAAAVIAAHKGATAPGRQLEHHTEVAAGSSSNGRGNGSSAKARGGNLRPPEASKPGRESV
jgi:type IV secretion system protein TrbL